MRFMIINQANAPGGLIAMAVDAQSLRRGEGAPCGFRGPRTCPAHRSADWPASARDRERLFAHLHNTPPEGGLA